MNSKVIISYSQFYEDITLAALLYDVDEGFYVDVGANHPTVDSVTKYFYEKGWNGINIEPIPRLCKLLRSERERDITICCGVGNKDGELEFREYTSMPGHSGFITPEQENNKSLEYTEYLVPVRRLKDIFKDNKVKKIHFLKIDVEGFEYEVIQSNDWDKYRPEVLCIEGNHKTKDWAALLERQKYTKIIFDGLNEYYLANESLYRLESFGERAAQLVHHTVQAQHQHVWQDNVTSHKTIQRQDKMIKGLQYALEQKRHEATLSFKGKNFRTRLKITVIGFTTDFLHYIKGAKSQKRKK